MDRREALKVATVTGVWGLLELALPKRLLAAALDYAHSLDSFDKLAAKDRIAQALSNPALKDKINPAYANSLLNSPDFDTYIQYIQDRSGIAQTIGAVYDGIPACIAMAQSLNESNAGLSDLAKNYNNYFGLTCKEDHKHKDYGCKFKNDAGVEQWFKNFAGQGVDASWHSYGDRLKNRFWSSEEGGKHIVYAKCFEQKSLWGRCKTLGETYAHSTTYATSLFTLIILFDLQSVLGVTMPLTDDYAGNPASQTSAPDQSGPAEDIQGGDQGAQEVIYVQCIEGSNLFRAVQATYGSEITIYNANNKLKGDAMLTVKKLCDYIQKNCFDKPGCGPDSVGKRCLPLDFAVSTIAPGTF